MPTPEKKQESKSEGTSPIYSFPFYNPGVVNEIEIERICNQYANVKWLLECGIITKTNLLIYTEDQRNVLDHNGISTLLRAKSKSGQPPLLTLEKALTLTVEEATVFDNHHAFNEVFARTQTIDEAIERYKHLGRKGCPHDYSVVKR